ncbi:hypothetical protein [uncultured Cedecea sp.]|uniref:hypothetical protein n=1 Tax=uncultured Cedecea sp. TaxID=988762 RepID=UPI002606443A|nr:hypothetical protein [uncultured Cedecea sp.]
MKIKRNNGFPYEMGNSVPVGETGAGKTALLSELILGRSDVTPLKRVYGAINQGKKDK